MEKANVQELLQHYIQNRGEKLIDKLDLDGDDLLVEQSDLQNPILALAPPQAGSSTGFMLTAPAEELSGLYVTQQAPIHQPQPL